MIGVIAAAVIGKATDYMGGFLAGGFNVLVTHITVVLGRFQVNKQLRIKDAGKVAANSGEIASNGIKRYGRQSERKYGAIRVLSDWACAAHNAPFKGTGSALYPPSGVKGGWCGYCLKTFAGRDFCRPRDDPTHCLSGRPGNSLTQGRFTWRIPISDPFL
jgi:hypothetical protein